MSDDDGDLIYAEEIEVVEAEPVKEDFFEIKDDTTNESDEEIDRVEEERRAYELFKQTGIVQAKKGGTGKSYLEEMDEGTEVGYEADKRKDGLKYFHRVGHTTAETTDKPLIIPPTEEDVEDLMLLDALRCSMGITDELDSAQFRAIRVKLAALRSAGLDPGSIFENPAEFSTLDEYYGCLEEEEEEEEYEIDDEEEHFLFDDDQEMYYEEEEEHQYFAVDHNRTMYDAMRPDDDDYSIAEISENFVTLPSHPEPEYYEDDDGNLRLRKRPSKKVVAPVPVPLVLPIPVPKRVSTSITIAELVNRVVGIPAAATSEAIIPFYCNNCNTGLACCGVCPAANPHLYPRKHRSRRVEVIEEVAPSCGLEMQTSAPSTPGTNSSRPTTPRSAKRAPRTAVAEAGASNPSGTDGEAGTPNGRSKPTRRVSRKTWTDK